jgi:drug/metabolite transporter (DMT)-like permease
MPVTVLVGLILAIMLDTAVQITWKWAVKGIPENASILLTVREVFRGPYFYVVMFLFVAQFVNWMRVLAHADLSYVQPFTALSYITVLTLSSYILHEQITSVKILGVALIFVGVFFISQTPHRTTNREDPQ